MGDPAEAFDRGFEAGVTWRRVAKADVRELDELERLAFAEGYAQGREARGQEAYARKVRHRQVAVQEGRREPE